MKLNEILNEGEKYFHTYKDIQLCDCNSYIDFERRVIAYDLIDCNEPLHFTKLMSETLYGVHDYDKVQTFYEANKQYIDKFVNDKLWYK